MAKMKDSYIKRIAWVNDLLFDAEIEVDRMRGAVSKYRYYFASDPNEQNLLSLRGVLANYNTSVEKVEKLRKQLEDEIKDCFNYYE